MNRTIVSALLLLFLFGATDVDAQRRRRRRRRRPAPQAETPPTPAPEETPTEDSPPAEEPAGQPVASDPAVAQESEPAPTPTPPTEAPAPVGHGDLREEFAAVMDELVQARARIATVGNLLFRTKLRVRVESRAGDQILESFVLRLDGAPIYRTEDTIDGRAPVFEGFAAPGPHELSVEVAHRGRANGNFRYVQSDRFRLEVRQGAMTEIVLRLDDDSDMAEDFPEDGEGEYDLRLRVQVSTESLEDE